MARARYIARSRIEHGEIGPRGKNVVKVYEAGDAVAVDAETAAGLIAAGVLQDMAPDQADAPAAAPADPALAATADGPAAEAAA